MRNAHPLSSYAKLQKNTVLKMIFPGHIHILRAQSSRKKEDIYGIGKHNGYTLKI